VHHLSPRIPNYNLYRCHEENPIFQQATVLTIGSSIRTARSHLWDEAKQRLVSFETSSDPPDRRGLFAGGVLDVGREALTGTPRSGRDRVSAEGRRPSVDRGTLRRP
jgi:hypothetical protein